MMLHQMRLLPAFHLMIARCIFGINGKNAAAAARMTTTSYVGLPRPHHMVSFPSAYISSSSSSSSLTTNTGCFQHCLPIQKRAIFHDSGSTRRYASLSPSEYSHSSKYGPVIHRSQSPTHLDQVDDAINSTKLHYQQQQITQDDSPESQKQMMQLLNTHQNILNFPPKDREAIGVVSNLEGRLRGLANSGDCRRCWLQKRHCICEHCVPLEGNESLNNNKRGIPNVKRLFLLTHHKEIGLTVDTAKLILSTFPTTTRLVVSGIGREFQPSMGEMLDAVSNAANSSHSHTTTDGDGGSGDDRHKTNGGGKCLILFPTEDATTFDDIKEDILKKKDAGSIMDEQTSSSINNDIDEGWDVVVIDGTWSQARKMHAKYLQESEGCLYRVQLSDEAVKVLGGSPDSSLHADGDDGSVASSRNIAKGHQLRRHPIKWREISTLEATRLLLNDMHTDGQFEEHSNAMAYYQEIGNDAAKRQLGPPRVV
mmetsp:Transcript_28489/g.60693  ORF Transcript_28489/g.60693 Transcript_28489/m.60693 type:complete len:481 (+) Transcript_28489:15-1457(+)